MKFKAKCIAHERWHIVDENGHPLYDGARDGNDKPVVFNDYDILLERLEFLNRSKKDGE